MKFKTKRIGKRIGSAIVLTGLCAAMISSSIPALAITQIKDADRLGGGEGGKIYSSFSSNEELQAATKEKNIEVASEGAILLKNGGGEDGTQDKLPYTDMKNISVFGIQSDAYGYGGTGSGSGQLEKGADVYNSYINAGLNINPKLKEMYAKYSGGSYSAESKWSTPTYEDKELPMSYYTPAIVKTYERYHDAAFIVITRLGGEGADLATKNVENRYKEDEEGNVVANPDEHYLQLSYKEKKLIEHVKEHFDKIVVLFNSGNIIEFGPLVDDPQIDAIVHVGQTGDYGFDGILKILKGEVNPSGRTVDFYSRDFRYDPTYQNFGNGDQTVATGTNDTYTYEGKNVGKEVEYEEGIYLGYKYYETMYAEIKAGKVDPTVAATRKVLNGNGLVAETDPNYFAYTGETPEAKADDWYNKNVIYPFGYGLSYTSFEWTLKEWKMSTETLTKDTQFTVTVTVKNTGSVAGKDVVELYMSAPYGGAGKVEKAAAQLINFAKTPLLAPGAEADVKIEFDAYDIAAYDYMGANNIDQTPGYVIESGNYVFTARKNSHEVVLTQEINDLTGIKLQKSQYTDATVTNVFVDSPNADAVYNYSSISPTMTIMSRSDMIGTFPKAPTAEEHNLAKAGTSGENLELDDETVNAKAPVNGKITKKEIYDKLNYGFVFGSDRYDETKEIWNKEEITIPANWTQAEDDKGEVKIRLPELMGYSPYDNDTHVVSANAEINGKTAAEAWDLFMNQLTYEEIKLLNSTGFFKTAAVERIGKEEAVDADGPCTIGGQTKDGYISARGPSGTRYWCSAQMLAATWNQELAHEVGLLIGEEGMWNGYNGWYAPSMNTHRSPFSGRNFEYYSQDGVHAGRITGQVISAVSSKGVYPYIKHFALNDQETNRSGILTWADEQTIRENIIRPFQYAVVNGGSCGIMTGFNRIGTVANSENYPLLRQILRDEWGFIGTIVTDYQVGSVGDKTNNLEVMTRSGNNIPLADKNADARGGGVWDKTLRNGMGGVAAPKVVYNDKNEMSYSKTEFQTYGRTNELQYYYARRLAMELLYTHCRSNAIDNGADFLKNFASRTISLPKAANITEIIEHPYDVVADNVKFELVESNLPEGVRFNVNTLTFTSSDKAAVGTKGNVRVKIYYNGWANKVVNFPVEIIPAINYTGALKVEKGAAYEATVSQNYWAVAADYSDDVGGIKEVTLSVDGLPEGLTFSAETGKITGTASKAGEYALTLKCDVLTHSPAGSIPSWTPASDTTNTYTANVTLAVGELVNVTVNGEVQKVEKGGKLDKPANPTAPAGMKFVGWYVGDTKFDFDTAIDADTVITAKFEEASESLTFRVEDGKIQASYDGETWTDVANLADLKGEQGPAGADGKDGANGKDGAPGKDGVDGKDGKDGSGCNSTVSVIPAVAALALVAAAFVVVKSTKKQDR